MKSFLTILTLCGVALSKSSELQEPSAPVSSSPPLPPKEKENRHLPSSSCSRLQYEIQKNILSHEWGLQRVKFQQRLKRHPQYIVTIQSVRSVHDPLIELRCPGSGNDLELLNNRLEMYFHDSRFTADSVRLFDIHSIFPIHTGALSVRIKLQPLVILLDKGSDIGVGIADLYWRTIGLEKRVGELSTKEHRENEESVLELEREIEGVFTRRIQPDVQKQIEFIVRNATTHFLHHNLVRFN